MVAYISHAPVCQLNVSSLMKINLDPDQIDTKYEI